MHNFTEGDVHCIYDNTLGSLSWFFFPNFCSFSFVSPSCLLALFLTGSYTPLPKVEVVVFPSPLSLSLETHVKPERRGLPSVHRSRRSPPSAFLATSRGIGIRCGR